jgi:hypothetical protein
MSINKKELLLDKLKNVLQKQIELAKRGNIGEVETLVKQAGLLMEGVSELRILELPEYKNYREKLQGLYKELCLILTEQKAGLAEELSQIRKGRKTIEVYRDNI